MSKKYTMSLRAPFASDWSKSMHESLAGALSAAWRKHKKGFSVDNVTHQQKVVLNNQALMQVIDEINILLQEQPKLTLDEVTGQAIQKMVHSEAVYS